MAADSEQEEDEYRDDTIKARLWGIQVEEGLERSRRVRAYKSFVGLRLAKIYNGR